MRAVVCLAGGIASGKTTVAQALAEGWPNASVRSFGDVVRRRVRAAGLAVERATLQDTGLRLIAEGWPTFVDELVTGLPPDADLLIVDGIRHVGAVEELRRRFPEVPVRLIYLRADEASVRERLGIRGESQEILGHQVESSLGAVERAADEVIEVSQPVEEIAQSMTAGFDNR